MLMMRPHPAAIMCGVAARIVWNDDDRLVAMMSSHFSGGKSCIGETNCMPALLTSMSMLPKLSTASSTIAAISPGWIMLAGEKATLPGPASSTELTAASTWSWSPSPFTMTLAPAAARRRAIPRPMPLVDPVTSEFFPASKCLCPVPVLLTTASLTLPSHRRAASRRRGKE